MKATSYLFICVAGFLSIALMFDCGVWYYSKDLVLYDDDEENTREDESTNGNIGLKENNKDRNITRTSSLELQNQEHQK